MADAQTNAARIGYIKEVSYGSATALLAALKTLRFSEESLAHDKNATWSNEFDSSGNRTGYLDISKSASGGFTSELSFTDFVTWLQAGIRAADATPAGGVTTYTNGTTVPSWYFEKQFTDITAGFIGLYGMVISEMTLALQANELAKISFAFMGKKGTKEAATRGIGSPAITAPATDAAIRCGADVANLKLDGSAFPCAVQSLNLTFNHNARAKTEIGADSPTGTQESTLDVSGTAKCYFPDTSLFEAMLAHTSKALSFDLSNAAGKFTFTFPALKLGSFTPPAGPVGSDVIVDIPFFAIKGGAGALYTTKLEVTPTV